jgi:hypothetical protein
MAKAPAHRDRISRPCHANARCTRLRRVHQYALGLPSIPKASSPRSTNGRPAQGVDVTLRRRAAHRCSGYHLTRDIRLARAFLNLREMLEWASIRLMQAAQYYWPLTADGQPKFRAVEAKDRSGQPILDANGKPTFNQVPVGDIDKFMESRLRSRSRRSGLLASSLLRCRPLRCRSSKRNRRSRSTSRCIFEMRRAST